MGLVQEDDAGGLLCESAGSSLRASVHMRIVLHLLGFLFLRLPLCFPRRHFVLRLFPFPRVLKKEVFRCDLICYFGCFLWDF